MTEKRLKYKCWHCEREYTLLRELKGLLRFTVVCPYCENEGVVDLAPARPEGMDTLRGGESDAPWEYLDLSGTIPTSKPE